MCDKEEEKVAKNYQFEWLKGEIIRINKIRSPHLLQIELDELATFLESEVEVKCI